MFYARDYRVNDIVFVVTPILLPNNSSVAYGTKAKVIGVQDNRVDLQIVSVQLVAADCAGHCQPVNAAFSLYDALGPQANHDGQSVTHIQIVFRENGNGPGEDYIIEGRIYPPTPPETFKSVSGPPHRWDSEDCGVEALASYGRRLKGD